MASTRLRPQVAGVHATEAAQTVPNHPWTGHSIAKGPERLWDDPIVQTKHASHTTSLHLQSAAPPPSSVTHDSLITNNSLSATPSSHIRRH